MAGEPLFAEGSTWHATNSDLLEARTASMHSECIESSCYYDDIGIWRCPECNPESTIFSWFTAPGADSVNGKGWLGNLCNAYDWMHLNIVEKASNFVLQTAKTHAHELGHNFGMSHDFAVINGGPSGPCAGTGIMSYFINSMEASTQWSTCSKSNFEHHYVAEGWGNGCLEDISGMKYNMTFYCNLNLLILLTALFDNDLINLSKNLIRSYLHGRLSL